MGSYVLGMGFVLTPDERNALIKKNKKNGERIFPYIGGEEVNSHPLQEFDRYVINFGDMTLEEAGRWPDLLGIVREKVKPERDRQGDKIGREHWWRFLRGRGELYAALAPLDRCLVIARVTKHLCVSFQVASRVYSEMLYVFPDTSSMQFGILQSRVHEAWARLLSSTMKSDLRYSASDCFETFAFPVEMQLGNLDAIGAQVYAVRAHYAALTWQGLTTTYNQLKDPDYVGDLSPASADRPSRPDRRTTPWVVPADLAAALPAIITDPDLLQPETRVAYIHHLRHLHEELDRAVLAAYGWSDIAVPPYCPPRPNDRAGGAAVSHFEDTIIDRLFALNAERAAEEQRQAPDRPAPLLSMTAGLKQTGTGKPKRAAGLAPGQPAQRARSSSAPRTRRGG